MPLNKQELINECQSYINSNALRYIELLKIVNSFLDAIKKSDNSNHIYRIYSRKDNKNEESNFKKDFRIADKLYKWRQKYNSKSKVNDIHDIIGMTVVVYYDSDIDYVFNNIKELSPLNQLRIVNYLNDYEFREYKKFGYHARHLVLSSLNPTISDLKCEVQIKTLLHDAWGAKTYNLTYKPDGELFDDYRKILESFGESIQSIEVQSEMIRSLITHDWNEEDELRYTARLSMLVGFEKKGFDDEKIENEYNEILKSIQENQGIIKTCNADADIIKNLLDRIRSLKETPNGLGAAWRLMMYLASSHWDNKLNFLAKDYLNEWAEKIENQSEKIFQISSAYYIMGERSESIRYIRDYFSDKKINNEVELTLKLNLLYYLIEEALYSSHLTEELKAECDVIKTEISIDKIDEFPTAQMRCAAKDTLGYYKITFGQTKPDIEAGIRLCQNAYPKGESDIMGGHFGTLHERTGWRRLLRIR